MKNKRFLKLSSASFFLLTACLIAYKGAPTQAAEPGAAKEEAGKPAAAAVPAQPGAEPGAALAAPEEKPVRKLTSNEPDPSLVLEPLPEDQSKPKKLTTKAPPRRPAAAVSVGGSAGGKISSSLTGAGGRGGIKLGRLPSEIQSGPEVAIILVNKQFFPSRIRLKEGIPTRLFLTTTNDEAAAIVVEAMQVQRWVAKEGEKPKHQNEIDRARFEVRREVASQRVTEIVLEPMRGTYSFHDVISGAKGQIIVE